MSIQTDIAEVKQQLRKTERHLRRLHNLLLEKLTAHADTLGLSAEDIVEAGTPKDENPGGGGGG